MNAAALFDAGQLTSAVTAALEAVRAKPMDVSGRWLLCELLCMAGDLERADKQLEVILQQDTQSAVGVSLFRQLIRAETSRREVFEAGRVPELLAPADDSLRHHLQAAVASRGGDHAEALRLLAEAAALRPPLHGRANGTPFEGFEDLDELLAAVLEVLTSNGKYYWVPLASVELAELHPPKRIRDLLWRQTHLVVRGGPDGEVYLPTLYHGSHRSSEESIRLGRETAWLGDDHSPLRGQGLRIFRAGEQELSVLELETLEVEGG